ncbi:MAG: glutamine-synthetase adenylyltransferase [Boseongicola sp.]
MSFSGRITRTPTAFDAERAAETVAMLPELGDNVRELVFGVSGASPFLSELLQREPAWIEGIGSDSPEDRLVDILSAVNRLSDSDLDSGLRIAKRRVALLAALADLGGIWSLEDVTGALTRFADLAVDRALKSAVAAEIGRGKLPGQTESDIAASAGLVAIAMGKMGAHELNYSSDIDLICLYDETRFSSDDFGDARTAFVRAVRKMTQILSERTSEGYVFRTDLRLRPDASVTPVAVSMEAAERYYEAFGRTWERAAYIKARAAAGDKTAGQKFLDALTPFVWRRHLDFAAIRDAHDMRLRIRDHKGLNKPIKILGHDLKLGRGGIREIEFFTQTRQIIAGGRDSELRVPGTVEGLTKLAEKGWVGESDADTLVSDYRSLREAEHRVQMIADQQTHRIPNDREEFSRLAALAGTDPDQYANELTARLSRVHDLTDGFFAPGSRASANASAEMPDQASEITERWPGYAALRSPRAVEIFNRMQPFLMRRLSKSTHPLEALVHFDGFLAGLPAGVQLFALFESNPQLLDLVVDIVDTAPALGHYLSQNAGVFDAVIGGEFFADWPEVSGLVERLELALGSTNDYETRLNTARVWAREWHFRIGVHHLRGLIDASTAGKQYADLAESILFGIWPHVVSAFADKHGEPPGRGAAILGMGSLGAARLTAASDLDLIVIYDGAGVEASEGKRPLATRAYYARLTQALVTALSAPTAEGRLYEVDMRLRPSGRQGPVATGLGSFKTYQLTEAWTWEHLALTRARFVAGSELVGQDVEEFRRELLARPREQTHILHDVSEMRRKLAAAKPATETLDVKSGPGRLMDIELLAQAGTLLAGADVRELKGQLIASRELLNLEDTDFESLGAAAELFWRVQAASRLIAGGPMSANSAGAGASAFLLRETGAGSVDALASRVADAAEDVAEIIDNVIVHTEGSHAIPSNNDDPVQNAKT